MCVGLGRERLTERGSRVNGRATERNKCNLIVKATSEGAKVSVIWKMKNVCMARHERGRAEKKGE